MASWGRAMRPLLVGCCRGSTREPAAAAVRGEIRRAEAGKWPAPQHVFGTAVLRRQGALAGSSLSEEEVAQLAEDAANLMVGSQAGPSKIPLPGSVLGAEATNLTALGATALAHSGVPSVAVTNLAWLCDGFNQVRLVWPALPEPIPASQHRSTHCRLSALTCEKPRVRQRSSVRRTSFNPRQATSVHVACCGCVACTM